MTPFEQALREQRLRLQRIERDRTQQIVQAYAAVNARLARNLAALQQQIERAERAGTEVRPGWLFAQARYRQLIHDLIAHTETFLQTSTAIITGGQRAAVGQAFEDGKRLARLALGPAPEPAIVRVTNAWDHMDTRGLDALIGRASDNGPLAPLLHQIAPLAPAKVRDALAYGVAAGKNPRVVARDVQAAAQITRNRALVIARTEVLTAHRAGQAETWQGTRTVQKWTWRSARDTRTCPACWAQDGTEHPVTEPMGTHPQCRCGMVPKTLSWAELGLVGIPDRRPVTPTGLDVFSRLSEGDKLAILGRQRLDAYNAGEITLASMVEHTHSPRWGAGIRVKPLGALA